MKGYGLMTELQIKIARIRSLDKDLIPEAIEDLERFRAIATATTPRYEYDGTQHVDNGNSKEKAFVECAEANRKIDGLVDELADLKMEVQKEIDLIPDDKQRRFAKLYYIDQLNQKQIAKKASYQYGTVRNNLSDVRKKLKLVTPNDTNCY